MDILTFIIYMLIVVLLVVFIAICIKLFTTIDKTNALLDDLQDKLDQVDPSIRIISNVSSALISFRESASYSLIKVASHIGFRKK